MKLVSPSVHASLDYLVVVLLAAAPVLVGLTGAAAALAYALVLTHLLLTVFTAFPGGMVKAIPFRLHGLAELAVGALLLIGPWVTASMVDLGATGRPFFSAFGFVLLCVWALTDYSGNAAA